MGQSAGSSSVLYHLMSPRSEVLFNQVSLNQKGSLKRTEEKGDFYKTAKGNRRKRLQLQSQPAQHHGFPGCEVTICPHLVNIKIFFYALSMKIYADDFYVLYEGMELKQQQLWDALLAIGWSVFKTKVQRRKNVQISTTFEFSMFNFQTLHI